MRHAKCFNWLPHCNLFFYTYIFLDYLSKLTNPPILISLFFNQVQSPLFKLCIKKCKSTFQSAADQMCYEGMPNFEKWQLKLFIFHLNLIDRNWYWQWFEINQSSWKLLNFRNSSCLHLCSSRRFKCFRLFKRLIHLFLSANHNAHSAIRDGYDWFNLLFKKTMNQY